MLSALPFEKDAIANGRIVELADISVRLPQVEDLLIMKAIANRPRDRADRIDRCESRRGPCESAAMGAGIRNRGNLA